MIGSGSFGKVFKGTDRTGRVYAVKSLDKRCLDSQTSSYIRQEIELTSKLDHENIVNFKFSFETDYFLYIFLEYCPGGDLESALSKTTPKKSLVRKWLRDLITGLKYLHEQKIMHRDLKPSNFLLTSKDLETANCKLADFGFAKVMSQSLTSTQLGSPMYMAPELFRETSYDIKADIWSLGSAIYEVIMKKPLFSCNTLAELIHQQEKEICSESNSKLSYYYKELIAKCLSKDPEARPTCAEILSLNCFSAEFEEAEETIEKNEYEDIYDFCEEEKEEPRSEDLSTSIYLEEKLNFTITSADIETTVIITLLEANNFQLIPQLNTQAVLLRLNDLKSKILEEFSSSLCDQTVCMVLQRIEACLSSIYYQLPVPSSIPNPSFLSFCTQLAP